MPRFPTVPQRIYVVIVITHHKIIIAIITMKIAVEFLPPSSLIWRRHRRLLTVEKNLSIRERM